MMMTPSLAATRARGRDRVGQVLKDRWRLDLLLGVGGTASVYAATHCRNGSRVAVKILHDYLADNDIVRERFVREGYLANAVGHDGVVRISDDDVAEDGSTFLVMEILDGETVEDRRNRFGGQLEEDDVLSIADQLLDVLVAAHKRGIIHRDLKPENLFLTRAGQLKVLDFGIARIRDVSGATATGTAIGTPAFMAPEQARGLWNEVGARSDLWATGATLFSLLTGRLVHQGRTTSECLLTAMTAAAPTLKSVLPDVSPVVAHLIDRALAYDQEKRWPTAERMQEATRHAYRDRHGRPITTHPRLTVPESVPNRTLTGALPTTAQPVALSPFTAVSSRWASVIALSGIVIGAIVVAGAGVSLVFHAHDGAEVHSVQPMTTAPPAPEILSEIPEIDAADLPIMPVVSTPAAPRAVPRTDCTPPYATDSTGHRHWKPQCL